MSKDREQSLQEHKEALYYQQLLRTWLGIRVGQDVRLFQFSLAGMALVAVLYGGVNSAFTFYGWLMSILSFFICAVLSSFNLENDSRYAELVIREDETYREMDNMMRRNHSIAFASFFAGLIFLLWFVGTLAKGGVV